MTFRYVSGDTSVEMSDGAVEMVKKALDSKPLIDALEQELDLVRADIRENWPVKSGESIRGWRLYVGVSRDRLIARVVNPVEYVRYVKGRKQKGRSSIREVVTKPALRRVRELVARIERNWARHVGGA